MLLRGKSANQRFSYLSYFRTSGNTLFVLCGGDHGLTEYEVSPDAGALRKTREIGIAGPVAVGARDVNGYVAVVGSSARPDFNPRRLCIVDSDMKMVSSKQFKTPVLGVEFSQKGHVAVCLGDRIFWYMFLDKGNVFKQIETATNPQAVFAISDDGKLLAYPVAPNVIGIQHGDEELARITTDSPISKLKFNPKGGGTDLLAAASEDGKTVWVWILHRKTGAYEREPTPTYVKQFEFSRSRTHSCKVEGLDFNEASTLLALSADSGTCHIFELTDANKVSSGYMGNLLPKWVPSVSQVRSKYKVRISSTSRSHSLACLMVGDEFMDGPDAKRSVFILTAEGYLMEYKLPEESNPDGILETSDPLRRDKIFV